MSMTITLEDLTQLARDVLNARHASYVEDASTAAAGVTLARAVIARDSQTAAGKLRHQEELLVHHEQMRDVQLRAINRLRLALSETDHADA